MTPILDKFGSVPKILSLAFYKQIEIRRQNYKRDNKCTNIYVNIIKYNCLRDYIPMFERNNLNIFIFVLK